MKTKIVYVDLKWKVSCPYTTPALTTKLFTSLHKKSYTGKTVDSREYPSLSKWYEQPLLQSIIQNVILLNLRSQKEHTRLLGLCLKRLSLYFPTKATRLLKGLSPVAKENSVERKSCIFMLLLSSLIFLMCLIAHNFIGCIFRKNFAASSNNQPQILYIFLKRPKKINLFKILTVLGTC